MATIPKVILLVEDETDLRSMYAGLLKEAGYDVLESIDGDDAYLKITSVHWDLLLLDIMLPKKDGMEILKEIINNQALQKGPIIMLSNINTDNVIQQSIMIGASDYIIKSEITPDMLVKKVLKFLPID